MAPEITYASSWALQVEASARWDDSPKACAAALDAVHDLAYGEMGCLEAGRIGRITLEEAKARGLKNFVQHSELQEERHASGKRRRQSPFDTVRAAREAHHTNNNKNNNQKEG